MGIEIAAIGSAIASGAATAGSAIASGAAAAGAGALELGSMIAAVPGTAMSAAGSGAAALGMESVGGALASGGAAITPSMGFGLTGAGAGTAITGTAGAAAPLSNAAAMPSITQLGMDAMAGNATPSLTSLGTQAMSGAPVGLDAAGTMAASQVAGGAGGALDGKWSTIMDSLGMMSQMGGKPMPAPGLMKSGNVDAGRANAGMLGPWVGEQNTPVQNYAARF